MPLSEVHGHEGNDPSSRFRGGTAYVSSDERMVDIQGYVNSNHASSVGASSSMSQITATSSVIGLQEFKGDSGIPNMPVDDPRNPGHSLVLDSSYREIDVLYSVSCTVAAQCQHV